MRGLLEVVPVQDITCSGIGAIEQLEGGNLRFWFYVSQANDEGGAVKDRIVVAKIVAHRSVVPDVILQTISAVTEGIAPMRNGRVLAS